MEYVKTFEQVGNRTRQISKKICQRVDRTNPKLFYEFNPELLQL